MFETTQKKSSIIPLYFDKWIDPYLLLLEKKIRLNLTESSSPILYHYNVRFVAMIYTDSKGTSNRYIVKAYRKRRSE